MSLKLEIITPGSIVFSDRVDSVVIPTALGEVGVLPGHIPLLSILVPGEIVLIQSGKRDTIAVDKGFMRIQADTVSVLTEAAIDVEKIDLSKVVEAEEAALQALQSAREQPEVDPAEIERIESIIRFSITQRLAKTRKF